MSNLKVREMCTFFDCITMQVKLVDPSLNRMQHLITQMKWRLREGQGEAIYEIGVQDDGTIKGLTDKELDASIRTLKSMAAALNASVAVVSYQSRLLHIYFSRSRSLIQF